VVSAIILIVFIAMNANPNFIYFQSSVSYGLASAFFTVVLAILLSILGYYVFDYLFFSFIQENERNAGISLPEPKFPAKILFPIMALLLGFVAALAFTDIQLHIFTPNIVEVKMDDSSESFERPIIVDLVVHSDIVGYSYYQEETKSFEIQPPLVRKTFSIESVVIRNPSNVSDRLLDGFDDNCNCTSVTLPAGVTSKAMYSSRLESVLLDYTSYQNGLPFRANFSYIQKFNQREITGTLISSSPPTDGGILRTFNFTLENKEDTNAIIRSITIEDFRYVNVDRNSTAIYVNNSSANPNVFGFSVRPFVEIMSGETKEITVSFLQSS
jgi:hypothetical protein